MALNINRTAVITSINPANKQVLAEIAISSAQQIEETIQRAHQAQKQWSQVPLSRRLHTVEQFRQLLFDSREQTARVITSEAGKPYVEALVAEVFGVLETCQWLRNNARRILAAEPVHLNPLFFVGKRSYNVYEPYGVIAVVSPCNYPFSIPVASMLSALTAGNAVVWKPSPKTAFIAQSTIDLFRRAGFPPDLVGLVQGDKDEAERLIASDIQRVQFTGSTDGGKAIMSLAAKKLLPVTLELGGKHPAIVLDDSDAETIARSLVWAAFTNAGQACTSLERLYVTPGIKEKLTSLLVKYTGELRLGDGLKEDTDVGPLIDEAQVLRVEQQVQDALAKGAKLLVGGRARLDLGGYYFEPTVLDGVRPGMRVLDEEIFGPILPIVEVADEQEAITAANDSSLGLGASLWTRDLDKAERLARQIQAGMVWINDGLYTHVAPDAPWGGIKQSGFGRMHSAVELRDLVYTKNIGINKQQESPVAFPYSAAVIDYVRGGIELVHSTAANKLGALRKIVGSMRGR